MGGLFELIMDNFFIVIIIVSAILGLFRSNAAEEEKKKQNNRPKTAPNPASRGQQRHRQQPNQNLPEQASRSSKPKREEQLTTISSEEQRKGQIERLTSQFKQKENDSYHHAFDDKPLIKPIEELTMQEADFKKQLSENLNRKGLINGIVMSEVLGSPRARKPYQNVIQQRRKS